MFVKNIFKFLLATIFFVSLAVFLNSQIFSDWFSRFHQIYFVTHNKSATVSVEEAQAFDSVQSLALVPKVKKVKKSVKPTKTAKPPQKQKSVPKKLAPKKTSPTLKTKKGRILSPKPIRKSKTAPRPAPKKIPLSVPAKLLPLTVLATSTVAANTLFSLTTSTPLTAATSTSATTGTTSAVATTTPATYTPIGTSRADVVVDTDPPLSPTLFEIRGTTDTAQFGPAVEGLAEASANIDIYHSSACSSQILGSGKTNPQGIFKVSIMPPSEETILYAKATDAAGNASKCSETGLVFAATHLECPSVPADLPITRPPIDVAWEGYNYFRFYKLDPTVFAAHQDELKAYPPRILGPGGFSGQVPFQWGGMGVVQGNTNALYGDWTENPISIVGPLGPLPAAQLQERINGIKDYINQYKGITKYFPYIDFGTQIFGHHLLRKGFWEFYDKWDEYKALFDIGEKPPDPTTWLRRLSSSIIKQSASYPDELAGFSFSYGPKSSPFYRYSVNILSPGWEMWWKQVVQWLAKVGYELAFVDNVYFTSCWNDECQTEYRKWLEARFTSAEIDKYFTLREYAPGAGSYWDRDFEGPEWVADTSNGSYKLNYAYAGGGGTLWPDEDSYHGLYSARLEGPAMLETATSPLSATGTYRLTIHYKTSPDAQASVVIDAASLPNEPVLFPLTSASNWTEYTQQITFPANWYRLRFKLDGPGKLWVDDVWIAPAVVVDGQETTEYPKSVVKLPASSSDTGPGSDYWYGTVPLVRLVRWAALTFWDSVVDAKITYLRDMARQINPKFEIFTNSYRPRGKADYFMVEGQAHKFEAGRDDVGNFPGIYKAGDPVRSGAAASDVLSTNIFDFRYVHSKRASDFFSYSVHSPVGAIHNLDSMLLHLAEVSAFGGGAGRDPGIRYAYPTYTDEIRKPYYDLNKKFFAFVDNNTDLFACLSPYAEVGIVFHDVETKSDQGEVLDLATALAGRGITYDVLSEERISKKNFDRFKVLIYYDVGKISDNEARLLLDFMAQGGVVIAVGDIGKYDSLYHLRAFTSSSIWPPVKFGGAQVVQQPVGSGKYIYVPAGSTNITDVTGWITDWLGRSPGMFPTINGEALSRMRAAVWTGQKRTVIHLVNYNVPLGLNNANQVAALENLEIKIKLPDTFRPSKVNIYSPEATSTIVVSFKENSDGTISFVVPKMRIYSIAEIK